MVVGQGSPFLTKQVCSEFEAWYRCVSDSKRVSYARYGLGYTTYGDIIGKREVGRGRRRAVEGGFRQHIGRSFQPASDWLQLPGAVLIDQGGIVRYYRRAADVAELADVDALLSAAEALASSGGPAKA